MSVNVTNLNGVVTTDKSQPQDMAEAEAQMQGITDQHTAASDAGIGYPTATLAGGEKTDSDIIRQGFLLPKSNRVQVNQSKLPNHSATIAEPLDRQSLRSNEGNFEDTSLGGYKAINPIPQITRFADIKKRSQAADSRGTGRYYQEAYTANAQIIHMRFGVPEYNSLNNFLADMYDPAAGKLARTGEGRGFVASVASAAAFVVTIPIRALTWLSKEVSALLFDIPYNRFYYSKPAMPSYYSAVNTMLTKIAINMKLIGGGTTDTAPTDDSKAFTLHHALSDSDRETLHRMMPDIFNVDTGFDIYRMAHKYQRLANQWDATTAKLQNEIAGMEKEDEINEKVTSHLNTLIENQSSVPDDIVNYQKLYFGSPASGSGMEDKPSKSDSASSTSKGASTVQDKLQEGADLVMDIVRDVGAWFTATGTKEMFDAETLGGSQWVSFKVDSTGDVSESFSNSTADSGLGSTLNGFSSSARASKFNMAGGNVSDGLFGNMAEWVTSTAAGVVGGVANAAGFTGAGVALGGGMVDIPKFWENSDAGVNKGDYSIKLRTPYGNKLSIFKDLYIPMCMLLGAALPLSTGTNTYTSPFLVELFDKGKVQTRLGMIDNLSITRGTGNLGWSVDGLPLGIDLSFSVTDLSNVMHMPISGESLSFNDQSKYLDYMAVLGGLGTLEQVTVVDRLERKILTLKTEFKKATSISNMMRHATDTWLGRSYSAFRKNTDIIT